MDEISPRQRKKQEVRDRLIAATEKLVYQQGLDGFTVDQIADRAGVGRVTFFRYFDSLNAAIVLAFYENRLKAMLGFVQAAPAGLGPADALSWMFDRMLQVYAAEGAIVLKQFMTIQGSRALQGIALQYQTSVVEPALTEAIRPRFPSCKPQDLRPRILVSSALSSTRSMMEIWTDSGGTVDLQRLLRFAMQQIKDGFPATEASTVKKAPAARKTPAGKRVRV
ncbi:TetR family transcriptional regulator [Solimonas sp. K1W22B-7]|uniref:TetR/AcrR family transcriptional regulator n=1 Tax=Solimonas sp. K1W22B-7 TaxID=2303331 RepID=UPI000E3330CB|nr:TetR family transcriptional regulator [Solimonas sp. K1W22B-7]AXQ27824.1 TetR family transcriptional regulator [Solimonas sp. K1W22B-7]